MAQKQKITDFLSPSTSVATAEGNRETVLPPPSKWSTHRQSFDPKWHDTFPWVLYNPSDDGEGKPSMRCRLCRKHNKTLRRMVWISTPCQLLRKDKLREHERSQCHRDALQAESIAAAAKRFGGIAATMEQQVFLQRQAVRGALKCLYWLAKEELAHHTKFTSLLELVKSLGCSYLSELEVGANARYTLHRMIDEFVSVLSDCVEQELLSKVRASPSVGILCDESTDSANLKQLVVFVRYIYDGKPHTSFLQTADIPDGKASTVVQALLGILSKCEIPIRLVYGFGSDGAAVMVGKRSGVATQLKEHNPEIVSLHCGAHRLALASSQAAQHVPYLKKFDAHLIALYYHFKNSPVCEATFHEMQRIMEQPVLHLRKAIHTRWLSHDQAVSVIRRTLPSLLATLEREVVEGNDVVAQGLVRAIKTYNFVATLYLLSDVLPHLYSLSLVFQRESVDLSIVEPQVAATIAALKHLRNEAGPYLGQLNDQLTKLATDFGLTVTEAMEHDFQEGIREKYIDKLIDNLTQRFVDSELLSALVTLFNPTKAACNSEEHGNSAVGVIVAHFTTAVDSVRLQLEWMWFKHILLNQLADKTADAVMEILVCNTSFSSRYPYLSKIASIALTLPVSTADCERGFSTMNRIKTHQRNRLTTPTLDKLIRLSTEGPNIEKFDFDVAVTVWAEKSNRRITV